MERAASPLTALRAVLLHAARTPKKNQEFLKEQYTKSMRQIQRSRFFLGNLWRYQLKSDKGVVIYTVLWIDPYNYDVLVLNHRRMTTEFHRLYGLIL